MWDSSVEQIGTVYVCDSVHAAECKEHSIAHQAKYLMRSQPVNGMTHYSGMHGQNL